MASSSMSMAPRTPCPAVSSRSDKIFSDLFATLSLKNGVDAKTLSGALGHYSAGFTLNTYTHATAQMKQDAADTTGAVISQAMLQKYSITEQHRTRKFRPVLSRPIQVYPRVGPGVGLPQNLKIQPA